MMPQIVRGRVLLPVIALVMVYGTAWAMQTGVKLTWGGRTVSTDIQFIKGRAYVPLSDMAKILDMTVVKKGQTYRLTQAAGSSPIHHLTGNMADNLTSGAWQFQVASVQQVSGYSQQYGTEKAQLTPKETGDILVVIRCRLRNGTKEMQEVAFDGSSAGNTALTDNQEHGYVPLAYDSRNSDYMSDKMPAGSAHEFVVIFSVPKGTDLKNLTYTVAATGLDKSTDFQVALRP